MKTALFDYFLPHELIAQKPTRPRDHSRLLILNKNTREICHQHFYDLAKWLQAGDVLVLNNSKVIPARLLGHKKLTGGQLEIFLLKKIKGKLWQCLVGGKGRLPGLQVIFRKSNKSPIILTAELIKDNGNGTWTVKFNKSGNSLTKIVGQIGQTPTPPYIKKIAKLADYQTIYAKIPGSVAAPTAGLHFTPQLFRQLKSMGAKIEFITLHVGFGTFQPVKVADISQHKLHAEFATLDKSTAQRLNQAKKAKHRIIAVGTTTVRTLETFSNKNGQLKVDSHWINTFIYPPYKFKFVDALITNFHLPKSTLLMLVCAFAGRKNIFKAYRAAIAKKYRFFSFGDAMLITDLHRFPTD